MKTFPHLLLFSLAALFIGATLHAEPKTVIDCELLYPSESGQYGKNVVWVPTPDKLVNQMLLMANVTEKDYVIDLGAGDGKIVIAAARDFGARGLGIEYNPRLARLAGCLARVEGVADKVKIMQGDIFREDFSKADVVTMYLLPQLNLCLRHRLLAMRPGVRVVSHSFLMGDWEYDSKYNDASGFAYLWIVPAKVGGDWIFKNPTGKTHFTARLTQHFQKIDGTVTINGKTLPLTESRLKGDNIYFTFGEGENTVAADGKVENGKINTILATANNDKLLISGSGAAETAAPDWAMMAPGCIDYYTQ